MCFGGMQAGSVVYASVSCENGKSKGVGIVQLETVEEALHAIDMLNGVELLGRPMQVCTGTANA